MAKQGATAHEVAERAGVSIATVSRVVRGIGQVAPETRRRVMDSVEALQYRPSHLGRALAARRHAALGIVFPGLSGPYYSQVILGFETEALAARMSVLILGTHLLEFADDQALELAARVDGLAIFGGTIAPPTIRRLAAERVPTVLVAQRPIEGMPSVRVANARATRELTLHLLREHGHDRLTFVGNPDDSPDVTDRWRGFLDAHRRAGVARPAGPVRAGLTQAGGLVAVAKLLDERPSPRALVCANDETALGAYVAAAARGISIPTDLAITGWDDIPLAGLVTPPLTTVRQPMRELGARAAKILLARIRGEQVGPADVVLPTDLVVRASCGCPFAGTTAAFDPVS